jgi:CBS domain-containing protein
MTIKQLMTTPVATVQPATSVALAGVAMLHNDCGILPVVNNEGEIVGVVTDRDICIAVSTRSVPAAEINVGSVATSRPITVEESDTVAHALEIMKHGQVRRLPVVDAKRQLVGMISMNDMINAATAHSRRAGAPTYESVFSALKGVSTHWLPVKHAQSEPENGVTVAETHDGDFDFEE